MVLARVEQRLARVDATFARVNSIADMELRSDFARYLCILVSGLVEQSVNDILAEYARGKSAPAIAEYVASTTERRNLNASRLLELVGSFSNEWRSELESYMVGERKDALDSVVKNRNELAHGKYTGISYQQISDYYRNVKDILMGLDSICLS